SLRIGLGGGGVSSGMVGGSSAAGPAGRVPGRPAPPPPAYPRETAGRFPDAGRVGEWGGRHLAGEVARRGPGRRPCPPNGSPFVVPPVVDVLLLPYAPPSP